MDTRDILKATESTRRLVQDETYYKYIFKKTEKIVSVVFYIVHNIETNSQNQRQIEDILKAAQGAHDAVLKSLQMRAHVAEEAIRECAHGLIVLESKLRVAQASGIVSTEVMHVFASEIDAVLRGVNKYLKNTDAFDDMEYGINPVSSAPKATPTPSTAPKSREAASANSGSPMDRRERIKVVLEAKGESTIKDISEIITDCSEKTIQRELNAMIEDNLVKRHGERRWSKYSIF